MCGVYKCWGGITTGILSCSSIFYVPQENPGYTFFTKLLRIMLVKILSSSSKVMVGPMLYRPRILLRDPEVEISFLISMTALGLQGHGIQSHHFMANRCGKNGNSDRLYFLGFQNHYGHDWVTEQQLKQLNCENFTLNLLKSEVKWKSPSIMPDSAIPWTVACQAPLSMGFPRQEYWNGLLILLIQGSNLGLPHCRQILNHLSHQGSCSQN